MESTEEFVARFTKIRELAGGSYEIAATLMLAHNIGHVADAIAERRDQAATRGSNVDAALSSAR